MNRDNFIKIRVSAEEMSAIKQKAEDANMSVSSFLRDLALGGKIILYDTENIYRFNQLTSAQLSLKLLPMLSYPLSR